jgi:predicted nucleic acid-binding protein
MKVYLDACCWCRPFDDHGQYRVRLEAEAVLGIIARAGAGEFVLAASEATDYELSAIADVEKLNKILSLYAAANEKLFYTADSRKRSLFFLQQGLKLLDSLHLALAEEYQQNVLLTTDDRFIKAATKVEVGLPVENPVVWLMKEEI